MTGYSQINPFLPELFLVTVFLPAKESKLRQELSVQRRGQAKMLSLLHHCAGTQLSPEKAASLPPESSYFQYTTKWDHHTFIQVGVRKTMAGSQKDPL